MSRTIGADRYIDEQLNPQAIREPPELIQRLAALDTLRLDPVRALRDLWAVATASAAGSGLRPRRAKARRERARVIVATGRRGADPAGDDEPSSAAGGHGRFLVQPFQRLRRQGARPSVGRAPTKSRRSGLYALGRFRDLLLATARHPAMLFYLDNAQNSAPGSRGAGRQGTRPQREFRARSDGAAHARGRWRLHPGRRDNLGSHPDRVGSRPPEFAPRDRQRVHVRCRPVTISAPRCSSVVRSGRAARSRAKRRSASWRGCRRRRITSPSSWHSILSPIRRRPPSSTVWRRGSARATATFAQC